MRAFTEDEIHAALGQLKGGLERYIWLQHHVGLCDVRNDGQFQKRFDGFYRVRRGLSWRSNYFSVMESAKEKGIGFSEALAEINRLTGRIEASFASKLVATLNPSTPVIDRFILDNFELKLPRLGSPDRESKTCDLYRALCHAYEDFLWSKTGALIRELFEHRFPNSGVTDLKKIDLVLWQIRP